MEETLRPAQRHRYVGKGGDSQERRRKEAGGRGRGQHTRRQADSWGGEPNAPFLQGPWPWGCLLFCQACLPPYLGVTVSRQLFSMKAEGRASPGLPAFQLAENFHLGVEAGGRGWGWEIHQETKKGLLTHRKETGSQRDRGRWLEDGNKATVRASGAGSAWLVVQAHSGWGKLASKEYV